MTKGEQTALERVAANLFEMNESLNRFRKETNERLDKIEATVAGLRTGVIRDCLEEARGHVACPLVGAEGPNGSGEEG